MSKTNHILSQKRKLSQLKKLTLKAKNNANKETDTKQSFTKRSTISFNFDLATLNDVNAEYSSSMTNNELPIVLVMAGGGVKGRANGPAIKVFEQNGVLQNIDMCIGSSVGGLNAAALALGSNSEELDKLLRTGGEGLLDIHSNLPIRNQTKQSCVKVTKRLILEGSIAKGKALLQKSQAMVAEKLGDPNATFSDLNTRIGDPSDSNGTFRNLMLTVTVDDPRGSYQIVCSPETTPNMPIALAMRMTAGLPPAFPVIKISQELLAEYTKGATEPLVKYDRGSGFPSFDHQNFYSLSAADREDKVNSINQEIVKNSFRNGFLHCSDGGVVDNMPVYLAYHTENVKPEEVIAFNFETSGKHQKRMLNQNFVDNARQNGKTSVNDELQYDNAIACSDLKTKIKTFYKDKVKKAIKPPIYNLDSTIRDNMLCFNIGDIDTADFELKDTKHMSHEQKVAFLERAGLQTAQEYCQKKGVDIPSWVGKEIQRCDDVLAGNSNVYEQVASMEDNVSDWETIIGLLRLEVENAQKNGVEIPTSLQDILEEGDFVKQTIQMHKLVKQVKRSLKYIDEGNEEVETILPLLKNFTEENFVMLLDRKNEVNRELRETYDALDLLDKAQNVLSSKFRVYKIFLAKTNPELNQKLDDLANGRKESKICSDMLSTTNPIGAKKSSRFNRSRHRVL